MKIYSLLKEKESFLSKIKNRFNFLPIEYEKSVKEILSNVEEKGDEALLYYTKKFDAPYFSLERLKVSSEEISQAYEKIKGEFLKDISLSIKNVRKYHEKQKRKSWFIPKKNGSIVGQIFHPVEKVGIYIPGGQGGETPLVSTIIMSALPAQIAGVSRIIMVTPPNKEGNVHPAILVTAAEIGIKEIYKVGSAWAIAALAYGTESIPKVDVICGPGNIYVTLAKKLLQGKVGIDIIAGPSEIVIVADDSARPSWLAADLLSQAEHDVMSLSIMITPSESLALKTLQEIDKQLKNLPRKDIARQALERQGGIILCSHVKEALEIANEIAPEHLELALEDPWKYLGLIKNAGAVFLGHYTPEAVGDYVAGPNHVLPTMGCARYASGLSVDVFLKKTSLIYYTPQALKEEKEAIINLANLEGLTAHAKAIKIRF